MQYAISQHGLITRRQLLSLGWRNTQISRASASGRLVRVFQSVYRIDGAPITRHQEFLGHCLSLGPEAFISHQSGAELHELNFFGDDIVHVTYLGQSRRLHRNDIRAHHSSAVDACDFTTVHGIPTTSIPRTIIDLAEYSTETTLGILVDDALQRRLVTLASLQECYERVGRWRGRKRFVAIKHVLRERSKLPQLESALEARVFRILTSSGLPTPETQFNVSVAREKYRLDLAYPDRFVAIEVDGYAFHSSRQSFDRDRRRDNDLRLGGWTVLHFTSQSSEAEIISATARALSL